MRAIPASWWSLALAGALAGVIVQAGWYASHPAVDVQFVEDHPLPSGIASGFEEPTSLQGARGAWIGTRGALVLHGIDRSIGWRIEALVRAPAGRTVTLETDARPVTSIIGTGEPLAITGTAVARGDRDALVLRLYVPDAASSRDVFVQRIRLLPLGVARPPSSSLVAAFALGASVGYFAWLVGAGWGIGLIAAGLTALVQSVALAGGLAAFTKLPDLLAWMDVALIAAAGSWRTAVRSLAGRVPSRAARAILAVSAGALHFKLLILLHPAVTAGDTMFHVHRFEEVMDGRYFLVSNAPGGSFPYAVAFYVIAGAFGGIEHVPWLLRGLACVADAVAGLLLASVVLRTWDARRALVCLALFHVMPQNLSIQGRAFLTNAFANSCATAAMAFGITAARRGTGWTILLASAVAFLAMVSHVSTGIILAGVLCAASVAALIARARAEVLAFTLILLCAAGLSWGLYYRHFAGMLHAPAATATAHAAEATGTGVPEMREEAHQTRWVPGARALAVRAGAVPGYMLRYYGWATLALAGAGVWLLARSWKVDLLARVTLAWLGACGAFLLLGVLTPVDLRYYLAAFPAVAIAASRPVGGGRFKLVTWTLAAAAIALGAWGWWRWLGVHDL